MNPVCPYCNAEIGQTDEGRTNCPTCGAAHHSECWNENGGCTVFGCPSAPGEGPTVMVNPSDIAATPAAPVYGAAQPIHSPGYRAAPAAWGGPQAGAFVYTAPPKSRTVYILLGIFLGIFGAHNFYAGYTGRAIAQLCITICTVFIGAIVSWIWAIVEVCIVDRDSRNVYMI